MKRFFGSLLVCALLAIPAFAASNSQTVKLSIAVQVGSTQLPAGDYKITWTGSGDSAKATLESKGIASITVPVKIVPQKNAFRGVSTDTQNGKQVLQAIHLSNVDLVL